MRTKKAWSLLLSVAMLIVTAAGAGVNNERMAAKAAEETEKIVVYVAAEGENESGDKVEITKTAVQVASGAAAEAAVKEVLDFYYPDQYNYSGWLSSIGSLENTSEEPYVYWGFKVNGEEPQNPATGWGYGIADYPLKDGDQISLVYGTYGTLAKQCASYDNDTSLAPDAGQQAALIESAKKQQELLAQKIYEQNFENGTNIPGIMDTDRLYDVFSLVQSGFQADTFYDAVASKIVSELKGLQDGKEITGADGKTSYTLASYEDNRYVILNYSKIALVLSALGQDIKDVGGMNLIQKLTDKKLYDNANPTTLSRDTMILFALDSVNAEWPSGDALQKSELIQTILNDVDNQIGYSTDFTSAWGATLDSAVMAIQALAPYTKEAVSGVAQDEVKAKSDRVLSMIRTLQVSDGGFAGANQNPWTLAQVMTTAGLFGINPVSDGTVIRDGKTFFDASLQYVDTEKQEIDSTLMGYGPAQLLRGITSCLRVIENENSLYDMTVPAYKATVTEYAIEAAASASPDVPSGTGASAVPSAPSGTETSAAPSASAGTYASALPSASADVGSEETDGASERATDTSSKKKNPCKKVAAAKKVYTIKKKGKTVKAVFKVTASDKTKKTTDTVTAKVKNTKIAVVKKKTKAKGKVTILVKGKKKGKTTLTVKVGKASAKTVIKVEK